MSEFFGFKLDLTIECDQHQTDSTEDENGASNWDHSWTDNNEYTLMSVDCGGIDVVSSVDFQKGDKAYLIIAGSGTGDSFGSGTNNYIEGIHLFKSEILARTCFLKIQEDYIIGLGTRKPIKVMIDDENLLEVSTCRWKGHFEGLDSLNLYEVVIGQYVLIIDNTINSNLIELQKNIKDLEVQYNVTKEHKVLNSGIGAASPSQKKIKV